MHKHSRATVAITVLAYELDAGQKRDYLERRALGE